MNKIIEIDKDSYNIECEAGCILENINNEVMKYNFIIPLDLGSKGSW